MLAQEAQPAPGAVDPILRSNNPICSLHIHHWPPNRTRTDNDGQSGLQKKNHWCQPALHSGHIQSKEMGRLYHCRPITHNLFQFLPSGRHYRALCSEPTRYTYNFFPQDITLMNSKKYLHVFLNLPKYQGHISCQK